MPLLDHFHPPLYPERSWESFHTSWTSAIAEYLNGDVLPREYFAEARGHVGSRVEVDVGTFEGGGPGISTAGTSGGAVAVADAPAWVAPPAVSTMPMIFPGNAETLVYSMRGDKTLVGAIELISPGNKDREEARVAFAAKCASYLHEGVGVIIVDVVTNRRANLHHRLIELLGGQGAVAEFGGGLYAVAYQPVRAEADGRLDIWPSSLAVGEELPVLPLGLGPRLTVPVDLNATYQSVCRRGRLI